VKIGILGGSETDVVNGMSALSNNLIQHVAQTEQIVIRLADFVVEIDPHKRARPILEQNMVGPDIAVIEPMAVQLGDGIHALNHRQHQAWEHLLVVGRVRHGELAEVVIKRRPMYEVNDPNQVAGLITNRFALHKMRVATHLGKDRRLFLGVSHTSENDGPHPAVATPHET